MKITLKIVKYAFMLFPALVILIIIVRVLTSGDPPESRVILNTPAFEAAHRLLGDDFEMHRFNLRNPFTPLGGDIFHVGYVFYLASSNDLQLSLRGKADRFEELLAFLNAHGDNFYDLVNLYLRVTTRMLVDVPGEVREETLVSEIFEATTRFFFETDRYKYVRVNFHGVEVDFARTRVELFIFDRLRDYNIELNLDMAAEYLTRITLFDIHMPRQRARVARFEILR